MRRFRRAIVLALVCAGLAASAAPAAVVAPAWRLDVQADTTTAPGGTLTYVVQMTNVGDAAVDPVGHPLTFTATLPRGVTALGVLTAPGGSAGWDCSSFVVGAQSLTCTASTPGIPTSGGMTLAPAGFATLTLDVAVAAGTAGVVTSTFELSGGGASGSPASTVEPTTITPDPPAFGVAAFDGTVSADPQGNPFRQAGGHPFDATVSVDFNTTTIPVPLKGRLWPIEPVKDVLADLPPGLVGDPTAADTCTADQLAAGGLEAKTECPASSQVGVAIVRVNALNARTVYGPLPIFNMVAPPGVPARFGFNIAGSVVVLDGELRSGSDYGLSVRVRNVPQGLAVAGTTLTFWGVPADSVHDPARSCPAQVAPWQGGPSCQNGGALQAFLRNPTSCTPDDVGLPVDLSVDSWVQPGVWRTARFVSHLPRGYPWAAVDWGREAGTTGCGAVPFEPGLSVTPDSRSAGVPSGYAFELTLPQSSEPAPVGQGDVRRAVVQLPEGVRVNPAAADGLAGCPPAQVGLRSVGEASCPDGSRVGSVSIVTPLLDAPVTGSIYLASPGVNPFGTLLAVYLVARGPGLIVKLAGRVESDALSGRLTAVFDELPQLPFSAVRLAFDGGPRAALVNPPLCGSYAVSGELTSWSGAVRPVGSSFVVDGGCFGAGARPFAPGFAAGVESPVAGGSSPFHLRLTRDDADEELRRVTVRLPRGLLGRLADVVLCADADASAGTCGDGSLIGHVVAGAGAGPLPFYIGGGRVYITGPYRGAPFGLSVVVPAIAGPFDLGTVVVRAAVFVDRRTTALRAVTDPLPVLLQGIPLQLRDVRVAIDRSGFMVQPTGCGEKQVRGVVESVAGRVVGGSARFQMGDCGELPFAPRLRLFVGSRGHTRARSSVPLTAVLTQRPGEAGIRSLRVTLPSILSAQIPVIEDACTPEEFDDGNCEAARVATAVAVTPLLRDPLRGGVYLVRPLGQSLPNLVIALRGQVDVDLVGRVAIPGGTHLAARFESIPDVPIKRVVLRFHAGARGVVGLARGLCRGGGDRSAATSLSSQSGVVLRPRVQTIARGCR
ncbi:MAG TPA: hypothetical protein VGO48_00560 [Conexibacter sp.]|nr:hypothetical protein [Conexibacter sp.]